MEKAVIGFIGGGNMAGAIIGGIVKTKTYPADRIFVFDRHEEKRAALQKSYGIRPTGSSPELVGCCDVVFLAVKPQSFPAMLEEIRPAAGAGKTFVSIAAGISSRSIVKALSCGCPVIRAMPNTPLLIGKGATAVSRTENVSDHMFELVCGLLSSCGTVTEIDESLMNAVISVNGSSPAYVYLFAKAILENAQKQGIGPEIALALICQTLEGSAGMLRTGKTPDELIRMVSSRGGTTIAALDVLKRNRFEQIIGEAMEACTARAAELGK